MLTTSSTPCKFKGLTVKEVDEMVIEFLKDKFDSEKDTVEQFVEEFNVSPNKLRVIENKNSVKIFLNGYGKGLNWQVQYR